MASTQAFDRRRNNGPESQPIQYHPDYIASKRNKGKQVASSDDQSREDARQADQIRPIFLKTGLISQASGSAYIEAGKAKLVCAVYGPHPTRRDAAFSSKAQLNVEVRYAPFATGDRHKTPGKDTEASHLSAKLAQALRPALRMELLPKSAIDLFVMILECDGPMEDISSVEPRGITASSLALAAAGVEMYGLVIGTCAAIRQTDSIPQILLDPTSEEMTRDIHGLIALASIPAMGTTTNLTIEGELSLPLAKEALEKLNTVSAEIHAVSAKVLKESMLANDTG